MRRIYLFIALALFGILSLTMPLYDAPKRSVVDLTDLVEKRREAAHQADYQDLVRQFGERHARQIDSLDFPQRYQPSR